MTIFSWDNPFGSGKGEIVFENGTKIPFSSCNLELTSSIGEGTKLSGDFNKAAIIFPQKESESKGEDMTYKDMSYVDGGARMHKIEDMKVLVVTFPNSNKEYEYYIHKSAIPYIGIGWEHYIVNDKFYNYRKTPVKVKAIKSYKQATHAERDIIGIFTNDAWGGDPTCWLDETVISDMTQSQREQRRSVFEEIGFSVDNYDRFRRYFYPPTPSVDDFFEREWKAGYLGEWDAASDIYDELFIGKKPASRLDGAWTGTKDEWGSPVVCSTESVDDSQLLGSLTTNSFSHSLTTATDSIKSVTEKVEELSDIIKNQFGIDKGDDNMNIFSNFDFGKVTKDNYAMTLKGIAYRSIGDSSAESGHSRAYVQYNPETNDFEDVTPFILDINVKDFLFKMPVATSAIKAGDIILDMQAPVFVKSVKGSEITVVDPITREVRTILATKNAFNFNFVTKIVNLMDNFNLVGSASAENPFGNILPLMMLSDNKNMKDMLPLMLLSNGSVDFASNPMMLYFLMKDGKSNDMLPFLLMSNGSLFGAPAKNAE